MLMKKIRFSLPIILAATGLLNLIQFIINWDLYFFSSFALFTITAIIFYGIIRFTTDEDGQEKQFKLMQCNNSESKQHIILKSKSIRATQKINDQKTIRFLKDEIREYKRNIKALNSSIEKLKND